MDYHGYSFGTTDPAVLFGGDGTYKISSSYRFPAVTIPQGSTIDSATLDLTLTDTGSQEGTPFVYIYAYDADDTATAVRPSTNTPTTAYVSWSVSANTPGSTITSPDIKTVVQEIVDRGGWVSGNALNIWVYSTSTARNFRRTISYDEGSGRGAQINITYTAPLGSTSPSASESTSPSASPSPGTQIQTEIHAYAGDNNDNAWGYGVGDNDEVIIWKLANAGSDTPGSWASQMISSDVTNIGFDQSPIAYHRTTESGNPNSIYYLKKNDTVISVVRYNIDDDEEQMFNGTSWVAIPDPSASSSPSSSGSASPSGSASTSPSASASSSPSGSASASPSPSPSPTGDILAGSQLTGLNGTNDRYFMRVEFGELYIGNGNFVAKVDSEGTLTERAFTLPTGWESVDMTFVADFGLILSRHINRKTNYCKAYWWDLTATTQFDDAITIAHGGPQWIQNFNERLYCLCAQNGVARMYTAQATPGAPLTQMPGIELQNVSIETSTEVISAPKMLATKDNVLYFGVWKTDKTGIYALGNMDPDKPTALVLAKRFDTTDYSLHKPVALYTQGPNFYASYDDNGAFKHARCETNNDPDRSSNAIYESIVLDEGDATKDKDILGVYLMTKPLAASTSVDMYIKTDYGTYTQLYREDDSTYDTDNAMLGNFRAKSASGKVHQFKFQLTSSGTDSPIVTGLAYVTRIQDTPAYG